MEFLMSREYSQILVKSKAMPMRADVAPAPGAKPLSDFKVVRPTDEEIVTGIPQVIEQWRDLFGN